MHKIICRHGVPKQLLTDKGTNFVSDLFKSACSILSINKLQTTAYHPICNGWFERFHKTLADTLSHDVNKNHKNWDEMIPPVLMALRSTTHFILHGHELELPFDDINCFCK